MPQGRRVRRVLRRIDPWTVLRVSVLFYMSLVLVVLIAGLVLWLVAGATGVRHNVERFVGDLLSSKDFHFLGAQILRASALVGLVLVVVGTVANVLMAVLYNLISDVVGGVEITVLEEDTSSRPVI